MSCKPPGDKDKKRGGRSVQKRQGKNRGASKIESRRVLAGRGCNILQGVDCIQGNRMSSVPGQAAPQECSKKRGGLVRLSCVGPRVLG
ncbi:LOW QUALITY PROTEIN: hypothetical protein YC2023_081528 [Brassica napus]